MSSRLSYLVSSAKGWLDPERLKCPNCGSANFRNIKRKYIVTVLRRCNSCRLLHRVPLDPAGFNEKFYNEEYEQGFTTEVPSDPELNRLLETKFEGSEKDYLHKVAVLQALGLRSGALVLDFGSSWGYGAWQLREAGFLVEGFEIGRARAAFAREKLSIPMKSQAEMTKQGPHYDAIFSSHVFEHIPSIGATLTSTLGLLNPGGLFVAFTPNGSLERAATLGREFHSIWGQVHPVLPDEQFYRHIAGDRPMLLATSPYPLDLMASWNHKAAVSGPLTGDELLVVIQG